ncbi:MAG TPA: hypothetical protein PKH15_10585 [Bacteroidales bacterium]|jgi:dihydroorotate dehydrogenase|nr:hypothetical protein [Bacteroidales bacterium]
MRQIILVGLFFGLILKSYSQKVDKIEFVDYKKVIEDISASASFTNLESKWDYEFILLLDSMNINRINEFRPDIVKDFRRNYSSPILVKHKKIISTDLKSIKDCFKDERLQELILNNTTIETSLSDKKLKSPIYIKDDKIAVYEIYGASLSECDRITLTDKGLLIEMIYIIQD